MARKTIEQLENAIVIFEHKNNDLKQNVEYWKNECSKSRA